MKMIFKSAVIAISLVFLLMADVPLTFVDAGNQDWFNSSFVNEAEAIVGAPLTPFSARGMARRTRRRTAVVVGSAAAAQTAAAQQQAAAAQQEADAAKQEAAAAKQQAATAPAAPAPSASAAPLPLGTVVAALPAGCTSTPVGGVEYYYCGGNFYRAVFHGNTLIYVTTKPE
jgi:hypothetical protein